MNENNMYLIPANSKKSQLIFGLFNKVDMIVLGVGITITISLLLVIKSSDLLVMLGLVSPALISAFMVAPVPNYHNTMTLIGNVYKFYSNRRRYYWRGWCCRDGKSNK